ncbi:DEAD/DEAH box helicase [Leadbetterella sp. DM7]|uniref:DEAD/DEAH box helicase n=1 Tax=Leadbetterella sp. DM7 TaxID=3235085 RepID=UPI00349EB170
MTYILDFKELNLIEPLSRAVEEAGYSRPTEIQAKAIPIILEGRDIIGCAQTGTGKTGAFAIPLLQRLEQEKPAGKGLRVLILTPTRELAIQIDENFKIYGKYLRIKTLCVYGGVALPPQARALKQGGDVLIATPGRLLDLIQQKYADISSVHTFVLDEADRMLDMGFIHDVKRVNAYLKNRKQTLFFSATLPDAARKLAASMLTRPATVSVTPVSSAAETIRQGVYFVNKQEKTNLLIDILKERTESRSLIFTRTRHGAERLAKKLAKSGITATAIHGSKSQNARQRALEDFKNFRAPVLIATDIAARGIDIEALPFVVNYELPDVPETYVHRIGRTGRAGVSGDAVSFCDKGEEGSNLAAIQKLIGFEIPVIKL